MSIPVTGFELSVVVWMWYSSALREQWSSNQSPVSMYCLCFDPCPCVTKMMNTASSDPEGWWHTAHTDSLIFLCWPVAVNGNSSYWNSATWHDSLHSFLLIKLYCQQPSFSLFILNCFELLSLRHVWIGKSKRFFLKGTHNNEPYLSIIFLNRLQTGDCYCEIWFRYTWILD